MNTTFRIIQCTTSLQILKSTAKLLEFVHWAVAGHKSGVLCIRAHGFNFSLIS